MRKPQIKKCKDERRAERDPNGRRIDVTDRPVATVRVAHEARGHARGKSLA